MRHVLRFGVVTLWLAWLTGVAVVKAMLRGWVPVLVIMIPADDRQPGPFVLGIVNVSEEEIREIITRTAQVVQHRPSEVWHP